MALNKIKVKSQKVNKAISHFSLQKKKKKEGGHTVPGHVFVPVL